MVMTKKTRFDTVEIRHYPLVLSDNPGGKYGPSIELGWEYINPNDDSMINNEKGDEVKFQDIKRLSLYEKESQGKRKGSLYLSHLQRELMLLEADFTQEDLKRAMQRKNSLRRRRSMSNFLMNPITKIQWRIQDGRRVKKLGRAKKNLQQGYGLFYEHSDIYR